LIRQKGNIVQKTFKHKDVEQILAEADDLLQQIDPEIVEYMDEEKRSQLEEKAESLKKLKSEVHDRIAEEKPSQSASYSKGVHEAIEAIVKAMKEWSGLFKSKGREK
jgi:hypothetical protein